MTHPEKSKQVDRGPLLKHQDPEQELYALSPVLWWPEGEGRPEDRFHVNVYMTTLQKWAETCGTRTSRYLCTVAAPGVNVSSWSTLLFGCQTARRHLSHRFQTNDRMSHSRPSKTQDARRRHVLRNPRPTENLPVTTDASVDEQSVI